MGLLIKPIEGPQRENLLWALCGHTRLWPVWDKFVFAHNPHSSPTHLPTVGTSTGLDRRGLKTMFGALYTKMLWASTDSLNLYINSYSSHTPDQCLLGIH